MSTALGVALLILVYLVFVTLLNDSFQCSKVFDILSSFLREGLRAAWRIKDAVGDWMFPWVLHIRSSSWADLTVFLVRWLSSEFH